MVFKLRLRGPGGKQYTASLANAATLADLQQEASNVFDLPGGVEVMLGFPPIICTADGSAPLSDLAQSGDAVTIRAASGSTSLGDSTQSGTTQGDLLQSGDSVTSGAASEEQIAQQSQADADLARRIAAEEEANSGQSQSQIEADEQLARRLAAEEEDQQPSQTPQSSSGPAGPEYDSGQPQLWWQESLTEALQALAPLRDSRRLRQDRNMGTMIDTVFEQLEEMVAHSQSSSSTHAPAPFNEPSTPAASTAASPAGRSGNRTASGQQSATANGSEHGTGGYGTGSGQQSSMAHGGGYSAEQLPVAPATAPAASLEEAIRAAARTGSVEAILRAALPGEIAAEAVAAAAAPGTSLTGSTSPSAARGSGYSAEQLPVAPATAPAASLEEAIRAAARTGSVEAILRAALPAEIAAEAVVAAAAPGTSLTGSRSPSTVQSGGPGRGSGHHAAAAARVGSGVTTNVSPTATSSSTTSSAAAPSHSARFARYMAGVEARRGASQRRREDRLEALNRALDIAGAAGLVGADHVPPAGDPQFVENNSSITEWNVTDPDDPVQCVICVEDLCQGDTVRKLLCGHVYHKDCIDVWLRRSRLCPLCKRRIDDPASSPTSRQPASSSGQPQPFSQHARSDESEAASSSAQPAASSPQPSPEASPPRTRIDESDPTSSSTS